MSEIQTFLHSNLKIFNINFINHKLLCALKIIIVLFYRLKLKVENTIRWREVPDKEGNILKESNARLVRWSDGSYSLHLGSEIFDVYKQPLQVNYP